MFPINKLSVPIILLMLPATYAISPAFFIYSKVSDFLYLECFKHEEDVQLILGTNVSVDPVSNNTLNV